MTALEHTNSRDPTRAPTVHSDVPAPCITRDQSRELVLVLGGSNPDKPDAQGWEAHTHRSLDEPLPTVTTRCSMGGRGNYWIEPGDPDPPSPAARNRVEHQQLELAPSFPVVNPDLLRVEHTCKRCGYEWSGRPA